MWIGEELVGRISRYQPNKDKKIIDSATFLYQLYLNLNPSQIYDIQHPHSREIALTIYASRWVGAKKFSTRVPSNSYNIVNLDPS
jgi:hypothetical protein